MNAWENFALCRQHEEPDMWFPDGFARPQDTERAMRAQRICVVCPVAAECLAAALEREGSKPASMRFGIFAATTPEQRAARVREQQKARREAAASCS